MPMTFDWEKTNALAKALGGRVELLQELIKLRKADLSYSQIQDIVKSGFASEFFDIGDEIMTKYTATDGTEYDFPWRVVDFRDVTWEDGSVHPGMVLQSKYAAVESVIFDAAEGTSVDPSETEALEGWYYFGISGYISTSLNLNPGDPIPFENYNSIYKNMFDSDTPLNDGLNLYAHSALRQWLNGDSEKGTWWTEQHAGDNPTADVNVKNGFAYGLTAEFKSIINPVLREEYVYSKDQTYNVFDRFFIAGVGEMYGAEAKRSQFAPVPTVKPFEYWKNNSANTRRSNGNDANRHFIRLGTDTMPSVWIGRKFLNKLAGTLPILIRTGAMNNTIAPNGDLEVVPCCVIS